MNPSGERTGRGTREKSQFWIRGFPSRPSQKPVRRETAEAFIKRHGLAPAIEYGREYVIAAYGELTKTVLEMSGYDYGFPYVAAEFHVCLGLEEHDLALEDAIELLLDRERAIHAEMRDRFGSAVSERVLVGIIPGGDT